MTKKALLREKIVHIRCVLKTALFRDAMFKPNYGIFPNRSYKLHQAGTLERIRSNYTDLCHQDGHRTRWPWHRDDSRHNIQTKTGWSSKFEETRIPNTYHITMDEGGHGMVTMIKHTIPSEEAAQIHLGDGTETLSTRILISNKSLLQHNIYRVDGELDITAPLTRQPRSIMVGDFNARDEMWCRDHNRAGRILSEQLQNLDNFCLMNHPQVWTTINKTTINLSLLPVEIAPLTNWSIYPGLLSDHLAVLLEIQQQHSPERVTVPKRWLTQYADWDPYWEYITTSTTNIEWTDVDINEANITKSILEAAELAIPKSSGKHQQHHTGRTTWELGWPSTVTIPNWRHTDDIHRRQIWSKYKLHTKSIHNCVPMRGTNLGTSKSPIVTTTSTHQRYVEELRQKKGTSPRPPTRPGHRKRQIHYVAPLLNESVYTSSWPPH